MYMGLMLVHNLEMFKEICDTITRLKKKYKDGFVIIGGDFNVVPDENSFLRKETKFAIVTET